jgi:hypothetical protein
VYIEAHRYYLLRTVSVLGSRQDALTSAQRELFVRSHWVCSSRINQSFQLPQIFYLTGHPCHTRSIQSRSLNCAFQGRCTTSCRPLGFPHPNPPGALKHLYLYREKTKSNTLRKWPQAFGHSSDVVRLMGIAATSRSKEKVVGAGYNNVSPIATTPHSFPHIFCLCLPSPPSSILVIEFPPVSCSCQDSCVLNFKLNQV